MDDIEFISMFRVEELPECATALALLKGWVESDPEAAILLQNLADLDVESIRKLRNPYFMQFAEHFATCQICSQTLEGVFEHQRIPEDPSEDGGTEAM